MYSEYERMEQFAYDHDIKLIISSLPEQLSGYYYSNSDLDLISITLSSLLETTVQKTCILAEELEHYFTTPDNLFASSKINRDKYECKARFGAARRLIPFDKLIKAKAAGIRNRYELAEYLNVTEPFLEQGIESFKKQYGPHIKYKDYMIYFDPLDIIKIG